MLRVSKIKTRSFHVSLFQFLKGHWALFLLCTFATSFLLFSMRIEVCLQANKNIICYGAFPYHLSGTFYFLSMYNCSLCVLFVCISFLLNYAKNKSELSWSSDCDELFLNQCFSTSGTCATDGTWSGAWQWGQHHSTTNSGRVLSLAGRAQ